MNRSKVRKVYPKYTIRNVFYACVSYFVLFKVLQVAHVESLLSLDTRHQAQAERAEIRKYLSLLLQHDHRQQFRPPP